MKAPLRTSRLACAPPGSPGFALIISILLMALLLVIAVGLLSLSSISLRESAQARNTAIAKSNARLALMLAVGELQKTLGPDQAVTAPAPPAGDESTPRHLTGVWSSWDQDPSQGGADYAAEKSSRFRQWLVSAADPAALRDPAVPYAPKDGEAITLANPASNGQPNDRIQAGRVHTADGMSAFAWHVSDEAAKARIDVLRDPSRNNTLAERRALLAGHRSGIRSVKLQDGSGFEFLPGDETAAAFGKGTAVASALVDLTQADLLTEKAFSKELRNDLTTHSLGVLADVRKGGLKHDLTAAFETTGGLPPELAGRKLYQSTHGFGGISDPYWSALSGYYNTYKQARGGDAMPSYKLDALDAVQIDRQVVPRNYTVAPVIAKFEIFFTFVVRNTHGPWVADLPKASADQQKNYMMHMIYLPVVTLHNPYNAEIEFERLTFVVRDVPVAFNFRVNGKPQNNRLVPFNEMFIVNTAGAAGEKAFMLDLGDWKNASDTKPQAPLKMKPGQTLVCGPYLDPASTSAVHLRGAAGTIDRFSGGDTSAAIKMRPGFAGKAVGISVDWLTPPEFNSGQSTDGNLGILGLRLDDTIRIESGIRRPLRGVQDKWQLSATAIVKNKPVSYGGMLFEYGDEATLQKYFDQTYLYPRQGDLSANAIFEPYTKALAEQTRGRAVSSFSAAARTANGGVYETDSREEQAGALNELHDGRLAGKPFLHHNATRAAVQVNLKKDLTGRHTHELNFHPLKGELDDVIELDATNRGPSLTGNTTIKGIKTGAIFDLPSGPLQTLAGFRRSNALSSTYLPHFTQPVGNSAVSPLMATSSAKQDGIAEYPLLDHSYLANRALYDSYYFSTFGMHGSRPADKVFTDFIANKECLANQCLAPWVPTGSTAEEASSRLFSGGVPAPEASREAAAWQTVKGAFNVNSTSVLAWKAMLASLSATEISILWPKTQVIEQRPPGEALVSAMTLPLGGLASGMSVDPLKTDNRRTNEWNGYRTLSEYELDALARSIVDEVKKRGPFLSMAEFVNRRLGPDSELTRGGALHAALEHSKVNNAVFKDMIEVKEEHVADPATYGYQTPKAATGNPAEGAPGWITQGDLLHILEPRATVRSDTFVIRTCGQAFDTSGKVVAQAYAEAVVQRVPDFIDSEDEAAADPADLNAMNRRFGRQLSVVSLPLAVPTGNLIMKPVLYFLTAIVCAVSQLPAQGTRELELRAYLHDPLKAPPELLAKDKSGSAVPIKLMAEGLSSPAKVQVVSDELILTLPGGGVAARGKIASSLQRAALIIVPSPAAEKAAPYRLIVIDDSPSAFPWGSSQAVNLLGVEIALEAGEHRLALPPGKITAVPAVTKVDEFKRAQVNFHLREEQNWVPFTERRMQFTKDLRRIFLIHATPGSQRPFVATVVDYPVPEGT